MSIGAHLEALRPDLTTYVEPAAAGLFEASQIQPLQPLGDKLKEASHMSIYDLLLDWNSANERTMCLPDEVLALCFIFLPFRARVFASHVSRRWRSVCLMHPAIWACLYHYGRLAHRPELFAMALERTGCHPVDVFDYPHRHDRDEGLLVRQMHHIRSLYYYDDKPHLAPLSCSAPLLETFFCSPSRRLMIENDFLGGIAGRLRRVFIRRVSLPVTCPALSTVTDLTLQGPDRAPYTVHFDLLFQLFPVLQSLTLSALQRRFSASIPAGPPPASLQKLCLSTYDRDYDLTGLYAAWRSDSIAVLVIKHSTTSSEHLFHFVDRSHTLDVQRPGIETSVLTVTGPGSLYRRLEYMEDADDQHLLAALLMDNSPALRNVSAMILPATSLVPFLPVVAVLPELAQLTVTVKESRYVVVRSKCRWAALQPLAGLVHRGNLRSLVLQVSVSPHLQYAPSARDVAVLLALLGKHEHMRLLEIIVLGFPASAVRDVGHAAFTGFRVVFGLPDDSERARRISS